MATRSNLMQHVENAIQSNWQYVFGAKGRVLSKNEIIALQRKWGKKNVWDSDINKAGKICCDCSGLISSFTGKEKNADTYRTTALEVKPINQRNSNMRGWGVWRSGHIGVYDGANGYYAMDGSKYNAVHKPLDKAPSSFTHIIKLCDINYNL